MYEFLSSNGQYVVLIITLIIWAGIFLYLLSLDKKISKLEK
ncbi:MAG: CcmD family protein [Ignavibacteria bacterium]|nr:CcmD family protein [Ignavibacteria bacterium]